MTGEGETHARSLCLNLNLQHSVCFFVIALVSGQWGPSVGVLPASNKPSHLDRRVSPEAMAECLALLLLIAAESDFDHHQDIGVCDYPLAEPKLYQT